MTALYLDWLNGNNANDGSSFANRFKNFTAGATAARTAPGDTVRCMKSPDPTVLGSCDWTNASGTVTIPSGTIKNVDMGDGAWTAVSANVTQSNSTQRKEGTNSLSLAIAAGFTTGLVAYKTLSSTDFSAYDTLNCYMRFDLASIAANTFRIDLCSDTLGATPVDSFTINFATGVTVNIYTKIVISKGSALGSAIQSIAIVALLDPGTTTILIDDIFVSKSPTSADCLTLHSLIATASAPTGIEHWYGIRSINGTTVILETTHQASQTAAAFLYAGPTQTISSYVRQPIVVTDFTLFASNIMNSTQEAGTLGSPITYSGGWDTTNMSTQTGETWITTPYVQASWQLFQIDHAFINLEKISAYYTFTAFKITANDVKLTDCNATCVPTAAFIVAPAGFNVGRYVFTRCVAACGGNMGNSGPFTTNKVDGRVILDSCGAFNNSGGPGFRIADCHILKNCTAAYNSTWGVQIIGADGTETQLESLITKGNTSGGISFQNRIVADNDTGSVKTSSYSVVGNNCLIQESTEVSITADSGARLFSNNHDAVNEATTIFADHYRITKQASTRHTASGYAWQIAPTSTQVTSDFPVKLLIGTRVLPVGVAATITAWVNRDNTGLAVSLVAPKFGGVVTTEQSVAAAGSVNTWEQLSISVTPAATGVVEIYIYANGGSTYSVYVDDLGFA